MRERSHKIYAARKRGRGEGKREGERERSQLGGETIQLRRHTVDWHCLSVSPHILE
jgi:hypothetical protein